MQAGGQAAGRLFGVVLYGLYVSLIMSVWISETFALLECILCHVHPPSPTINGSFGIFRMGEGPAPFGHDFALYIIIFMCTFGMAPLYILLVIRKNLSPVFFSLRRFWSWRTKKGNKKLSPSIAHKTKPPKVLQLR